MASFFLTESGQVLDLAKRAAYEAVSDYATLTPYTVGLAVQAAAGVLQASTQPPRASDSAVGSTSTRQAALDVTSTELTPRVRMLEQVARAAQATHSPHDSGSGDGCLLCAALERLDTLDRAS